MPPTGQLAPKLFNQPGLADAGFASDLDELTLARKSAFRTTSQDTELALAADERGEKLDLSPASSAAYPQYAVEIHGRTGALNGWR